MANVLDFVEPVPFLSDDVLKPPIVSNCQCGISNLKAYLHDKLLDRVVEMFTAHGSFF